MTTRRLGRLAASAVLGLGAAAVAVGASAAPASADVTTGSGASCSGSTCTVRVSFTGTAAPPSGSAPAAATVQPDCWYERYANPQEFLKEYEDFINLPQFSGKESILMWGSADAIRAAAKDPKKADWSWYMMRCRDGIDIFNDPGALSYAQGVVNGQFTYPIISLLLAPGQTPPAPQVDVETLRDAAREAMTIPEPTIEHNPDVPELDGGTLVNLPTWFSVGQDYADSFFITASVGPVSATVTATEPRWLLSSRAGGVACSHEQMTQALSSSTADACSLTFTQSSDSMGVDATSTWDTSWSGDPAPAGPLPLDTISATSGIDVPVGELHTIVTDVD